MREDTMRRLLMLTVVVALLAVSIPALAAPPNEPNPNAWTEIPGSGHYLNNGQVGLLDGTFNGKGVAVKVYESGEYDGMETLLAQDMDDVPCPKDLVEPDGPNGGTWWDGGPVPPGFYACHHFDHGIEP
jgi:hypothetical protein